MRVLVTGHEGFIGQHLARELHYAGHEVTGFDRDEGDLRHPGAFAGALRRSEAEQVIHLAAQVGREFGEADVRHTIESNALATALVASFCGQAGVPVLYASTSEVYGDQGVKVCHEDGLLALPHNLYGLTKRWGEEVLRLYAPEGLRIVRLSMPYGPGAPPGRGRRALDNMLWQAHHGMAIPVHRGAERSWCHVSDTARGIRMVMEHGQGEVYNVGRDDSPAPMLGCALMACDLAGADYDLIELVDPPARQTVVKRLDTSCLRALGWKPEVELLDGMAELLDWVRRFDAQGRFVG